MSSPHLLWRLSVGEAYRSKIVFRFGINIYSPVKLKKIFSTSFAHLHIFCVRDIYYQ